MDGSTSEQLKLCGTLISDAKGLYQLAIAGSLLFTVFCVSMYLCCLKSHLDGAPKLAAQFFFVIGSIKIAFAAAIWIVFQPTCPELCSSFSQGELFCNDTLPPPIYPPVALLIGLRWIANGYSYLQLARVVAGENENDKDGPIFDAVSTIEMA